MDCTDQVVKDVVLLEQIVQGSIQNVTESSGSDRLEQGRNVALFNTAMYRL